MAMEKEIAGQWQVSLEEKMREAAEEGTNPCGKSSPRQQGVQSK